MKYLYIASLADNSSSVREKVFLQLKHLTLSGLDVKLLPFTNTSILTEEELRYCDLPLISQLTEIQDGIENNDILSLYRFYKLIKQCHYDTILLRYHRTSVALILSLAKGKKWVPIFESIIEKEQFDKEGVFSKLLLFIVARIRNKFILSKSLAVVGVTDEIARYYADASGQKTTHILPNSIEKIHKYPAERNINKVVAIGNISKAQGFDRIIPMFNDHRMKHVHLYFIGDGPALARLKEMAKSVLCSENIHFSGVLDRQAIENELHTAAIGISPLAAHKKGLKRACALKTREYLSFGLPVILGYDDVDLMPGLQFVLQVPPDDTPISADDFLSFHAYIQQHSFLREDIYAYVNKYMLYENRMKLFAEFLKSQEVGTV